MEFSLGDGRGAPPGMAIAVARGVGTEPLDETIAVKHNCQAPGCGRPFAVVCRRSLHDVPLPMAVACPRCGGWAVVMVPTGAVRETEGSYVLPIEPKIAALTV